MKNTFIILASLSLIWLGGCAKENKNKDRSEATDMFKRICSLTKEYTEKLNNAPDSASWADCCQEYEHQLDKISFSYPPDTDLLLTEGQNDTIHSLMLDYVKTRDERIHSILYPVVINDTIADSSASVDPVAEISQASASRNPGN